MRRFGLVVALMGLPVGKLAAQHAGQFEAGAFSSYTRYDPAFGLADKVGGGVRLGYLFGDLVGIEGDVLFQPQYTVSPLGTPITLEPLIGSASVVVNVLHASHWMLYALGGYSVLDFGTRDPYHFTDNAAHAAVPDGIDKCPETPLGAHVDATGCPTDADGDGVPDGIDQCPNTPAGVHVDAKGCPIDSDGDGVPDGIDQCPDTPPGATVDARGCPADSDGDGVPDGIDKCPNTPKGAIVDATGCPLDSDLDGVPDGIDQCPNTPPGTRVDAVGCPLPAEQVKAAPVSPPVPAAPAAPAPAPPMTPVVPPKCPPAPPGSQVDANGCLILFAPESVRAAVPGAPPRPTVILRGVNFQTGRSALTRDSYAALDAVAASLVANPDIRIEIAGYTDSTGRKFLNFRLSQARAAAVRAYLARKGVLPARMVAKGYGATGDGRAQHRRVELHKLP